MVISAECHYRNQRLFLQKDLPTNQLTDGQFKMEIIWYLGKTPLVHLYVFIIQPKSAKNMKQTKISQLIQK